MSSMRIQLRVSPEIVATVERCAAAWADRDQETVRTRHVIAGLMPTFVDLVKDAHRTRPCVATSASSTAERVKVNKEQEDRAATILSLLPKRMDGEVASPWETRRLLILIMGVGFGLAFGPKVDQRGLLEEACGQMGITVPKGVTATVEGVVGELIRLQWQDIPIYVFLGEVPRAGFEDELIEVEGQKRTFRGNGTLQARRLEVLSGASDSQEPFAGTVG